MANPLRPPTEDCGMSLDQRVLLPLREIRVGAICRSDIRFDDDVLLLKSGQPLDQMVYDRLIQRGIESLLVDPRDLDALRGIVKRKAQPKAAEPSKRAAEQREKTSSFGSQKVNQIASSFHQLRGALSKLESEGDLVNADFVREIAEVAPEVADSLRDDADLALFIASYPSATDSLAHRCIELSVISTGIALELEFPEEQVMHVAMAGLLHDIGLYRQPEHFRKPSQFLSAEERWRYQRHPLIAADLLSQWTGVPESVCAIVAQVHERPDGSGFPRGLRFSGIHPGAAILGLVDSYLTLIHPGPGRPPVLPADAMGCLLHLAHKVQFPSEYVRAFLNQMTLYPIGSQVRLDDGSQARVVRRDADNYTSPVVETVAQEGADSDCQIIALSESPLAIAAPIANPELKQMRIETSMMPLLSVELSQPAGI